MKHIFRLSIILLVSLIGELMSALIPLPVPAGIYGMVLMFIGLCTRIIPLSAVRTEGGFLIEIMPVMFIPAAVGLLDSWDAVRAMLVPLCIAMIPVTLIVMAASGHVTQRIMRANRGREDRDNG